MVIKYSTHILLFSSPGKYENGRGAPLMGTVRQNRFILTSFSTLGSCKHHGHSVLPAASWFLFTRSAKGLRLLHSWPDLVHHENGPAG